MDVVPEPQLHLGPMRLRRPFVVRRTHDERRMDLPCFPPGSACRVEQRRATRNCQRAEDVAASSAACIVAELLFVLRSTSSEQRTSARTGGLHPQRADNSECARGCSTRHAIPAGNTEGPSAARHESGARRTDGRKRMDQGGVVLGYDIHGESLVVARPGSGHAVASSLGMTGSGKTTLLKNIITQDLMRHWTAGRPSQNPDGDSSTAKATWSSSGIAAVHPPRRPARRSTPHHPARPELSSLYNRSTRRTTTTWRR